MGSGIKGVGSGIRRVGSSPVLDPRHATSPPPSGVMLRDGGPERD